MVNGWLTCAAVKLTFKHYNVMILSDTRVVTDGENERIDLFFATTIFSLLFTRTIWLLLFIASFLRQFASWFDQVYFSDFKIESSNLI
jgi:hypothetical protein